MSTHNTHHPTVHGVGIVGGEPTQVNGERCPIYVRWRNMIKRCYSEAYLRQRPAYRGCTVAPEWLYFPNFKEWYLEQERALGDLSNLHLDKDGIFGDNKVYSPTRCRFVSPERNVTTSTVTGSVYALYHPEHGVIHFVNQSRFARDYDLQQSAVSSILRGIQKAHRGWTLPVA
ncbi:hypothetical protein AB4345_05385 [Vibrio breoganii]